LYGGQIHTVVLQSECCIASQKIAIATVKAQWILWKQLIDKRNSWYS